MQFKLHVTLEKQFYYFTGQVYGLSKRDYKETKAQRKPEQKKARRQESALTQVTV